MEVGGRGRVYTCRYTVTTRMTCIKMGSDESHFTVSLIVRDKVTRECPQPTIFEEIGEPKRYRTEVPIESSTELLFIRSKHNMRMFVAFPFMKLQNDT